MHFILASAPREVLSGIPVLGAESPVGGVWDGSKGVFEGRLDIELDGFAKPKGRRYFFDWLPTIPEVIVCGVH